MLMKRAIQISAQNRDNWMIDAILFGGAAIASLSGVYFLFNTGGYQGGRNPAYDAAPLFFSRFTWDVFHTWSGIAMILAVAIHLPRHTKWIGGMSARVVKALQRQPSGLSGRGWYNLGLNIGVAISFALTTVSGIYFLFYPGGPRSRQIEPTLLFDRTGWDIIHVWSGVILIIAAILHIAIHWRWIVNVSRAMFIEHHRPQSAIEATHR